MTIDDLRVFVLVSQLGSLSAAARRLECTQPAVSQHLRRVEQELGLPLFTRHARGVLLTEAGAIMQAAALESLALLDRSSERVSALRRGDTDVLTIATGGTTVKHFMTGAVTRFRRAHPKVRLSFRAGLSSRECVEMLLREPVDLAFVTMGEETERITQQALLEMDYVLLTGADHALARKRKLVPLDLVGIERIGLVEGATSNTQLTRALSAHGVPAASAMTMFDWDSANLMVELGLGSAIVPRWHAEDSRSRARVVLVPITGLPPVRFGWARRAGEPLTRPASAFVELLREELQGRAMKGVRVLKP